MSWGSIVELYGVLTSSYELNNQQVGQALDVWFRSKQLVVEGAEQLLQVLRLFGPG